VSRVELPWSRIEHYFYHLVEARLLKIGGIPAVPGRSFGPKAQPFIQRRAKPWYIGRTACYILLCFAVFGPTGQEFACWTNGTRGIEDELLARWAGRYREHKGILLGPPYQGFALLRWAN
jgi:hypothetical protein